MPLKEMIMSDVLTRDMKNFKRTREIRSTDILFAIANCPDRKSVLLGSSDAGVYELDLTSEKSDRIKFSGPGHRSYVTGIAVTESQAVSCGYDGQLVWWDLQTRQAMRTINAHDKWIRRIVTVPSRNALVSVADDMRCRVWDAVSGERIADFTDHDAMTPHHFPSMLYAVAASPDGRWIATGDRIGHVAIWDTQTWAKKAELEAPVMYTWDPKARRHSIGGIRSLAFSPDSSQLAVGGTGKINNIDHLDGRSRLEVFDWQKGTRLHEFEEEKRKGLVEQIVWIPETTWILAAGGDNKGFLTFFDTATNAMLHQDGCEGHIHGVTWDANAASLLVAAHERVEVWSWEKNSV